MNPLLGISIPAYKRPELLLECLRSIVLSAGKNNVPIFISDDSTDDTNIPVIREVQVEYPWIIHHRNSQNLGIDRNIAKAVDICTCKYAWLMGEDDRLLPEALSKVLDALNSSQGIPFLFVNYASVDKGMHIILKDRAIPVQEDCIMPAPDFLRRFGWAAGFLGACVIRKEYWEGLDREQYYGTFFAHIGTIFQFLAGHEVYVLADPVTLNRSGSPETFTWVEQTFPVLDGWSRTMDQLERYYGKGVCDEAKKGFVRAHGLDSLYFLLYLRAGNSYNWTIYKNVVRKRYPNMWKRIGAALIAVLPRFSLRVAASLLNLFRGIRHGTVKQLL